MSFPSRPQETFGGGRARSSSFNHSVIRRQHSDLLFTNTNSSHRIRRRPSFDSHVHRYEQRPVQTVASHSNFLAVSKKHVHNGASSIDDDSEPEEYNEEEDELSVRTNLGDHRDFVGKKKKKKKYACKSSLLINQVRITNSDHTIRFEIINEFF